MGRPKGDSIGDRMKGNYEDRTRYLLPRRTWTVVRVDGKAFHTYTRGMERPYSNHLAYVMNVTAQALCRQMQGAKIAFVQSDEISVVLTDWDDIKTDAWFDGNVQKVASVSASIATAAFNEHRTTQESALFDARVFTIPQMVEVENYLIWRQQDATRNSIQMLAQAHFSHKEMHGLSCDRLQEKLFQEKGINWNDTPVGFKRGRCLRRHTAWIVEEPPIFTQDRGYIQDAFVVEASLPSSPVGVANP